MATQLLSSARGFSLIEVMVALLVLSIGVLAILTLQLVSLRTTRDTLLQSSALQLATDIAEQVRASAGSSDMLEQFSQLDYLATSLVSEGGGDCYGVDSTCTPAQIAAAAMREWCHRLREMHPGGRLKICRDTSPWQASSKSMRWECSDLANAGSADGAMAPLWIKLGWPAVSALPSPSASHIVNATPQLVLPIAAFAR